MKRSAVLAVCVALVAASCGDDDSTGDDSAEADTTQAPATEPPATEPPPTEPPTTEPPATEPPATDPPATTTTSTTTTTEPPPPPIEAVGLVPLPGGSFDFTGQPDAESGLVWSLFSGSGGVIVENIGGPLPPGCHGTSIYDPETFDLLQIEGRDLDAYATRGEGGCGGMQQEVEDGVVDGDAVKLNTDDVILFDFGALPGDPFDVSTQVLDPDGQDGVFRASDPLAPRPVNELGTATHVIGANVLFEWIDGDLVPLPPPPPPTPGDCTGFEFCFSDRFGIEVSAYDGTPGRALVSGDESGLFTFFNDAEWEALVHVLNGCQINQRFWVFAAASTQIEFNLTVTDTVSGEVQSYTNPLDNLPEPVTDTSAFATCP